MKFAASAQITQIPKYHLTSPIVIASMTYFSCSDFFTGKKKTTWRKEHMKIFVWFDVNRRYLYFPMGNVWSQNTILFVYNKFCFCFTHYPDFIWRQLAKYREMLKLRIGIVRMILRRMTLFFNSYATLWTASDMLFLTVLIGDEKLTINDTLSEGE